MPKQRIGRPSHATVVAYLALFVALSGTAIAASGKIGSNKIKKGGVKTKNLAKKAVKEKKIDDGAVATSKIGKQAVTQGKLAPESVGNAKLQTNSVSQKNLQNGSVGTAQLLSESVGDGKLKPGAVIRSKIADEAVNGAKVEDGSLGLSKVAQVISDFTLAGDSMLAAGECLLSDAVTVPGLDDVTYILVIPRIEDWDPQLILDGYQPGGADDEVRFRVCNITGGMITTDDVTVRILGFG